MNIIDDAYHYAEGLYQQSEIKLPYHNWEHTKTVYNAVQQIIKGIASLNNEQVKCLKLAVIFHDSGYLKTMDDHEKKGAEIAEDFLNGHNEDKEIIERVKSLIMATKLGYTPQNELENIIIDADLSHLGDKAYFETAFKNLRQEIEICSGKEFTDKEWTENCLAFLSKHNYLTSFAEKKYGVGKEENIKKLSSLMDPPKKAKKKKKNKGKIANPLKGVETMFKVALRNHVDLSAIADKKANTLISVNAIIISIVLSALFPKLDSNPFLFYPSVTILVGSFFTIMLAILSTIPKVTHGHVNKDDVKAKRGNLLFFGNFHEMQLNDYIWGVGQLMESKDYIYKSMTVDLYFLGKVLNKKYILLRWSYYTFMVALLLSIIIFVFKIIPYIGTTSKVPLQDSGLF